MKTNQSGKTIVKKWEGIQDGDPSTANLDPYLCPAGYWTIGWGHVVRSKRGTMIKGRANKAEAYAMFPGGITMQEAELLLEADLVDFENGVQRYLTGPTTSNQFSAMVSLAFNIGLANFSRSSVLRHHNAGRIRQAADSFLLWNKARDPKTGALRVLTGLTSRRKDERGLYLVA